MTHAVKDWAKQDPHAAAAWLDQVGGERSLHRRFGI